MTNKIQEAKRILVAFGMDSERSNERSALILLALLHLRRDDAWRDASNPMLRTRAIMDWIRDQYEREYRPNTRETIRRFTLHQFAEALLIQQNPDQPDRPINSPYWNYQITPRALTVIQQYGTPGFESALSEYLAEVPGLREQYAAARKMNRIPVNLPGGKPFTLSPGGQNLLLKQMVEEFCSRFTPGAEVLYVGDADSKWALFEAERLAELGVTVDQHGKMPDLVVYMADKDWLVLLEAANSHGPVDAKRHGELAKLFESASPGLVYVSCFSDRKEMRKYLHQIAWATEVWCAGDPTHLIHFNGERFLGPYD
ncbi:type II restriction endonuclease BsuBI [Actinomadura sp. NBRC 104412]|uniref:BsuBI/PstI family type II restriction endonuclease n=1 Tax=Actinomadura sp. NBRC 104412 TaxID=3032203 RepID=UPI0024A5E9CD|nr:BsuBI/PstI family type II restriction endonuclease [Actinomadura sp. NBRC 104412]GLZ06294.1 type II restriction endonuclease BsuBI [Actinomadura sp. NBRC 104412]